MSLFPVDEMNEDNLRVPFDEAAETAGHILEESDQAVVFQTFRCSHCGEIVHTMEPNAFYEHGICYECGNVTNLRSTGCGFVVAVGDPEDIINSAADLACGKPKGNA